MVWARGWKGGGWMGDDRVPAHPPPPPSLLSRVGNDVKPNTFALHSQEAQFDCLSNKAPRCCHTCAPTPISSTPTRGDAKFLGVLSSGRP